jgi:hypothetical protein
MVFGGKMAHYEGVTKVRIVVTDPETGKVLDDAVIENNYVLITVGNRYLKSSQVWGRTHQLNVAVLDRK